MARIPNLKLTEDEVSQEFDLKNILGVDVSGNEGLRVAFAQAVIDKILNRTAEHKDAFNKSFAKYSESYKDSVEFKAFKSGSGVDMRLTGDMLSSIDILESDGNKVKVGLLGEQAAKAYGHMTGMRGHEFLDGVTPTRVFFGVTDDDLKKLKGEFVDVTPNEDDNTILRLEELARRIFG